MRVETRALSHPFRSIVEAFAEKSPSSHQQSGFLYQTRDLIGEYPYASRYRTAGCKADGSLASLVGAEPLSEEILLVCIRTL